MAGVSQLVTLLEIIQNGMEKAVLFITEYLICPLWNTEQVFKRSYFGKTGFFNVVFCATGMLR